MTAKHSPPPWRVGRNLADYCVFSGENFIADCDTSSDGEGTETDRANAAFIVRAANSHHALVEALQWVKAATFTLESYERDYGGELPSNFEIGRIDDSRNSASFRIQVGHIRKLAAALKLAESGQ